WLRKATGVDRIILGYAQSWALFHLLLEERPRELRRYLTLIYDRRTPDHRLADFAQAFGADLDRFEKHYQAHMRDLVREQARPGKCGLALPAQQRHRPALRRAQVHAGIDHLRLGHLQHLPAALGLDVDVDRDRAAPDADQAHQEA